MSERLRVISEGLHREGVCYDVFPQLACYLADEHIHRLEIALHAKTSGLVPCESMERRRAFHLLSDLADWLVEQNPVAAPCTFYRTPGYHPLQPPPPGKGPFDCSLLFSTSLIFSNIPPYSRSEPPLLLVSIESQLRCLGVPRMPAGFYPAAEITSVTTALTNPCSSKL